MSSYHPRASSANGIVGAYLHWRIKKAARLSRLDLGIEMLCRPALGAVLQPLFVAWAIWVTNEIFTGRAFREAGDRFTQVDAATLQLQVDQNLHQLELRLTTEMAKMPPADFRKKVDSIDAKLETLVASVTELRVSVAKLKP